MTSQHPLTETIVAGLQEGATEDLDAIGARLSLSYNDIDMFLGAEFPNGCYVRKFFVADKLYNVVRAGNAMHRRTLG